MDGDLPAEASACPCGDPHRSFLHLYYCPRFSHIRDDTSICGRAINHSTPLDEFFSDSTTAFLFLRFLEASRAAFKPESGLAALFDPGWSVPWSSSRSPKVSPLQDEDDDSSLSYRTVREGPQQYPGSCSKSLGSPLECPCIDIVPPLALHAPPIVLPASSSASSVSSSSSSCIDVVPSLTLHRLPITSSSSSSASSLSSSTCIDTMPPSALHVLPITLAPSSTSLALSSCSLHEARSSHSSWTTSMASCCLALSALRLKNSGNEKKPCASRSLLAFLCLLIVLSDFPLG